MGRYVTYFSTRYKRIVKWMMNCVSLFAGYYTANDLVMNGSNVKKSFAAKSWVKH